MEETSPAGVRDEASVEPPIGGLYSARRALILDGDESKIDTFRKSRVRDEARKSRVRDEARKSGDEERDKR